MHDIKPFLQQNKWKMLGKWKHTMLSASIVNSSIVDRTKVGVFSSIPRGFLNLDEKDFVIGDDHKEGIEEAKRFFEGDCAATVKQLKGWVFKGCERLNQMFFPEFTFKTAKAYIDAVSYHGRHWCEIDFADGALSELYPASLPMNFKLLSQEWTPQSLLARTALPKKVFPMIEEYDHLFQMAIMYKKGKSIEKDLARHVDKYSWMNSLCWWDEPFSADHYRKEVENHANGNPEQELKEQREKRRLQYEEAERILIELRKDYPQAWQYIDAIRELADLKEENWDAVSYAGVRHRPAFKALANRFHLSYNQFMMHSPQEFLEIVAGKRTPDADSLNARLKHFALISTPEEHLVVYEGSIVAEFLNIVEGEVQLPPELKGTVIWQGCVQGVARILNTPDEVPKMREGEILVCPMSDPDYMPAIRKAVAIVTDQGGLLCHAAIVARELQVPCVVGTEYATKVFKNGDSIEVDAARGIIRKIKCTKLPK